MFAFLIKNFYFSRPEKKQFGIIDLQQCNTKFYGFSAVIKWSTKTW